MRAFIVIGAGSAGCVTAAELSRQQAGSISLDQAAASETHPLVTMPIGLLWLMGSRRDRTVTSAPQAYAGGREIKTPRGKMVGGSGSINSMARFRGRASDFDDWQVPGWGFDDVETAFEAVEEKLRPSRLLGAHPLTAGLSAIFPNTRAGKRRLVSLQLHQGSSHPGQYQRTVDDDWLEGRRIHIRGRRLAGASPNEQGN